MPNQWTQQQRDAVRAFLGEAQPNNHAILVKNIETFMPRNWRDGFEALFAKLAEAPKSEKESPHA